MYSIHNFIDRNNSSNISGLDNTPSITAVKSLKLMYAISTMKLIAINPKIAWMEKIEKLCNTDERKDRYNSLLISLSDKLES